MTTKITRGQQATYRTAGKDALLANQPLEACPYTQGSPGYEDWTHGWWSAYYERKAEDTRRVALWLDAEAGCTSGMEQATILADMIINHCEYDHTQPILGQRIGTYVFCVPAPSTLSAQGRVIITYNASVPTDAPNGAVIAFNALSDAHREDRYLQVSVGDELRKLLAAAANLLRDFKERGKRSRDFKDMIIQLCNQAEVIFEHSRPGAPPCNSGNLHITALGSTSALDLAYTVPVNRALRLLLGTIGTMLQLREALGNEDERLIALAVELCKEVEAAFIAVAPAA